VWQQAKHSTYLSHTSTYPPMSAQDPRATFSTLAGRNLHRCAHSPGSVTFPTQCPNPVPTTLWDAA
jgi:hypothetical protein